VTYRQTDVGYKDMFMFGLIRLLTAIAITAAVKQQFIDCCPYGMISR